jgi:hypothetical protein
MYDKFKASEMKDIEVFLQSLSLSKIGIEIRGIRDIFASHLEKKRDSLLMLISISSWYSGFGSQLSFFYEYITGKELLGLILSPSFPS